MDRIELLRLYWPIIERRWHAVTTPVGFTWSLPFTIQRKGMNFKPNPSFDLLTHAGITVTKTYYVDVNTGSDANTGADWAHAIKGLSVAIGKADVDRIYVAKGYYFRSNSWSGENPARSIQVIGDLTQGVGDKVYITSDCRNQVNAFSLVDSHYVATTARTIREVWDAITPNSWGHDVRLTKEDSIAHVDANPGTWYLTGGSIYVHTLDSRAPDAYMRYYESGGPCLMVRDALTLYIQDLDFRGGWWTCHVTNATAAGGTKFYAKNCSFAYGCRSDEESYDLVDIEGVEESFLWNCQVYGSPLGDAINYKALNGIVSKAFEFRVNAYACGNNAIDQGSTMHDGGSIVRLNGHYHHTDGQCIADIGAEIWMLGVRMYSSASSSTNRDGFWMGAGSLGIAWLDRCQLYDLDEYALISQLATTIRTRKLFTTGVNHCLGTLEEY